MHVAHAFLPDGTLIYSRGGIDTAQEAADEARAIAAPHNGDWLVVRTSAAAFGHWARGDRAEPAPGYRIPKTELEHAHALAA